MGEADAGVEANTVVCIYLVLCGVSESFISEYFKHNPCGR